MKNYYHTLLMLGLYTSACSGDGYNPMFTPSQPGTILEGSLDQNGRTSDAEGEDSENKKQEPENSGPDDLADELAEDIDESDECDLPSTDFYKEKGPFEVATKSASQKTFFYPKNPKPGCQYPAMGWGNGMGVSGSSAYRAFNSHLASWGVHVCAHHGAGASSGREASSCLSAIVEDNEVNQQIGEKRLTAGHSMGGGGAVNGADRDDVVALISVQTCASASGGGLTKAGLYLTGTSDWANCNSTTKSTFQRHTGEAFLGVYAGAGHVDTPLGRGAGAAEYRGISVAWALCWASDMSAACELFRGGSDAGIKEQGKWVDLKSKNID